MPSDRPFEQPLHAFFQRLANPALIVAVLMTAACAGGDAGKPGEAGQMDQIAESYVKLVLSVGQIDADYVDAYYGPEAWRTEAESGVGSPTQLQLHAADLARQMREIERPGDPMEALRHTYLTTQLSAVEARLAMLNGESFSFDEESRALYDAVAPTHGEAHFEAIVQSLDPLLPGEGTMIERWQAFRSGFVIPPDKVDAVFRAAIEACKARTAERLDLPAGESFNLEYVQDKTWSGYNWYKGGFESLIQINTDLPIYIDRAVDLACHEGYPGHHVYNMMLERAMVHERGWMEFSVYPLFSPQSLIAEGTANYGIEMAFPGDERVAFEREVLFPLAGLDPQGAGAYYEALEAVEQLAYAGNDAARLYLDGEIDEAKAIDLLTRYAMMTPERAAQRVGFIEQYRAYVINYNLGQDLVRAYVEAAGESPDARWERFGALLSSPRLPSGLAVE